jgi:hypothetical protein
MPAHGAKVDQFAEYTKMMRHLYGKDCPLMSRERWDAACSQPSVRKLTDDQFDDNQFSEEMGDGTIY